MKFPADSCNSITLTDLNHLNKKCSIVIIAEADVSNVFTILLHSRHCI